MRGACRYWNTGPLDNRLQPGTRAVSDGVLGIKSGYSYNSVDPICQAGGGTLVCPPTTLFSAVPFQMAKVTPVWYMIMIDGCV